MGFITNRVMMLVILTTVVASASVAAAVKYDVCFKQCTKHECTLHHHMRPSFPPCEDLCFKKCVQEIHQPPTHGGAGHRGGGGSEHGHGHGHGHGRGGHLGDHHDNTDKFCESRCLTATCRAELMTKLDVTSDKTRKVVEGCVSTCTKTCRRSTHERLLMTEDVAPAPAPGPVAMGPYYPPPVDHRRHCPGVVREAWPELVGQNAYLAQQIIQEEDPSVVAIIVKKGSKVPQDFRCDRVWVWSDTGMFGFVVLTPIIG